MASGHRLAIDSALIGKVPALTAWSRLEPLPAGTDLAAGLEARVADPLWLLARQWQFDELHGEDAGTPIELRLHGESARLGRYAPGPPDAGAKSRAVDFDALGLPLEAVVECEPARADDDRFTSEAGLHLLRLLDRDGLGSHADAFVGAYPFAPPDETWSDDPAGARRRALIAGRAPDGAALAAALSPLAGPDGAITALPAEPRLSSGRPAVLAVLNEWFIWYGEALVEEAGEPAWMAGRLEYGFTLGAELSSGPVVLSSQDYTDGRLDWYSFRAATGPSLGAPATPVPVEDLTRTVIPAPVRYPGMPSDRLWGFEDGQVYLGALDAGPSDIGRLLMVEFALIYGTDWFVVPIRLPAGSVSRIASIRVRDTFGVESEVGPSRDVDGTRWTMFDLSGGEGTHVEDAFFLPPTLPPRLRSTPLEEVALFRDEMANMAWAVERVVQGQGGGRINRAQEVRAHTVRQSVPGDLGDARIIYRLMSTVPENWIPLVPTPSPDGTLEAPVVDLERRAMLRLREDGSTDLVEPRGRILRPDPTKPAEDDPLTLDDAEVPRGGVVVERAFQLARDPAGRTVMWVGRRKRAGRGEGASGLRFDAADPPEPDA